MKIALYIPEGAGWRPYGLIDAAEADAMASRAAQAEGLAGHRAFVLDGTVFGDRGLLGLPALGALVGVASELGAI